jgi:hypothetical protein
MNIRLTKLGSYLDEEIARLKTIRTTANVAYQRDAVIAFTGRIEALELVRLKVDELKSYSRPKPIEQALNDFSHKVIDKLSDYEKQKHKGV